MQIKSSRIPSCANYIISVSIFAHISPEVGQVVCQSLLHFHHDHVTKSKETTYKTVIDVAVHIFFLDFWGLNAAQRPV